MLTVVQYSPAETSNSASFYQGPKAFLGFIIPSYPHFGLKAALQYTLLTDTQESEQNPVREFTLGTSAMGLIPSLASAIKDSTKEEIHIIQFNCKTEELGARVEKENLKEIIGKAIKDATVKGFRVMLGATAADEKAHKPSMQNK